jgi:RloB-like protein
MPVWRQPKLASGYRRRSAIRDPYDIVLIACEGRKTEPNYFSGLRIAYGLSSVNIKILSPIEQNPVGLVKYAIDELERDSEYSRAYCVFDRNGHANFDAALGLAKGSKYGQEKRLITITSFPCFEIWILLHYCYSTAPYATSGGVSACERVIRDIQKYFPAYTKGRESVFSELANNMGQAIKYAAQLERHNAASKSSNPSTEIHCLVNYLVKLKG